MNTQEFRDLTCRGPVLLDGATGSCLREACTPSHETGSSKLLVNRLPCRAQGTSGYTAVGSTRRSWLQIASQLAGTKRFLRFQREIR